MSGGTPVRRPAPSPQRDRRLPLRLRPTRTGRYRPAPRAARSSQATLASILRKSRYGVRLNEHLPHECGLSVFQHACLLGWEGIVSKRLGSRYRSGRSPDWLKFKNPNAPSAARRRGLEPRRVAAMTGLLLQRSAEAPNEYEVIAAQQVVGQLRCLVLRRLGTPCDVVQLISPSRPAAIPRTGSRPPAMPPCRRSPDAGSGRFNGRGN